MQQIMLSVIPNVNWNLIPYATYINPCTTKPIMRSYKEKKEKNRSVDLI